MLTKYNDLHKRQESRQMHRFIVKLAQSDTTLYFMVILAIGLMLIAIYF